jgi:hypothetical protein
MRGTRAAVATCCVLALFSAACDEAPPERRARPLFDRSAPDPCWPEEQTHPLGYTNRRADRFFEEAVRVTGDRVSHEGLGCVEASRLVVDLGVKDLTERDRRRIEALAPPWMRVNLFETKYSMKELRAFGDRAQALLEDTGLHIGMGQGYYGTPGKVEIYVTKDWFGVHKLLTTVIPADSFVLEEQEPIEIHPLNA